MPIFEYQCATCGAVFETLVKPSDPAALCESCGSSSVEKLLSTFNAGSVSATAAPCATGGCPSTGMAGTGCSGGCPHSG